jgi:Electron transfer DM13
VKRLLNHKRIVLPALAVVVAISGWLAFGVFSVQSLFIDNRVNEAAPAVAGSASGERTASFESGAHTTTGTALLLAGPDGKSFLRFENFATENGPDLKVYLRKSGKTEFIDLGSLKGNIGSQNYEITQAVTESAYDTVDIWCARFDVSFGKATFTPNKSA